MANDKWKDELDATICSHAGALATHCSNRSGGYSGKKAIWQASVYDFSSLEDFEQASFTYRRYGCPNAEELGAVVASLEGAEAGGFSSRSPEQRIVVFLESITNPLVKVANISVIANICKRFSSTLIVDNTMATPLCMKPLLEGADLVIHSASKYLGGHSDLLAGVVVGSSCLVDQAAVLAKRWGLTAAPFDAWLAIRGIHTLEVRMQQSWRSAGTLYQQCLASGLALNVFSAPMCAVLCAEVHGGLEGVRRAIKAFTLIRLSPSFGGTSTTVSHSATSSHKCLGSELRAKLGISDGILRISVGLEDVWDIWADLQAGLLAASS